MCHPISNSTLAITENWQVTILDDRDCRPGVSQQDDHHRGNHHTVSIPISVGEITLAAGRSSPRWVCKIFITGDLDSAGKLSPRTASGEATVGAAKQFRL